MIDDVRTWWRRQAATVDGMLGVGVFLISLMMTGVLGSASSHVLTYVVLCALNGVGVAWRRTRTELGIGLVVVVHLLLLLYVHELTSLSVSVPIMLYAAGSYSSVRWRQRWLLVGLAGGVVGAIDWFRTPGVAGAGFTPSVANAVSWAISNCLLVLVSWALGALARQRRITLETLRERAASLERERDSTNRLAAQEERARIAREMHDVVAHSLSVIVVQADGAGYAVGAPGTDAEQRAALAGEALRTIGSTARTALDETRRLVGVLREEGAGLDYAPQAMVDQIGELVEPVRAAGLPVTFEERGSATDHAPLGSGAEMAAYRVVQESITNVLKHAGPGAAVTVTLEHRPDGLRLTISDTGAGASVPDDGHGHGLVGMRERVETFGGTLVARPGMRSGYEVNAWLPAAEIPAAETPAAETTVPQQIPQEETK